MSNQDFNLYTHFRRQGGKDGARELLCTGDGRSYSYADVDRQSAQVARCLADLGVAAGDLQREDRVLPSTGGDELANSDAFASCQVKKVFRAVCLREPENSNDRFQISQMVNSFKAGYRMRQAFAEAAVYCMGD